MQGTGKVVSQGKRSVVADGRRPGKFLRWNLLVVVGDRQDPEVAQARREPLSSTSIVGAQEERGEGAPLGKGADAKCDGCGGLCQSRNPTPG